MAESKSKFVEWRAKSVKWFARTKWGRFLVLLLCGGIGFSLLLTNVLFDVLKYLFSENDNNSSLIRAMLLGVIGLVLAGQWVLGKPKIFTKRSNRFVALLFCAFLGLILGVEIVREDILNSIFRDYPIDNNPSNPSMVSSSSDFSVGNNYDRLRNSLVGVIIGLFVFIALWVFRTMDTREQINKTQEQINFGLFSDAKKSFFSEKNLKERTAGFVQLVKLQQQKLFQEEIKIIFKGGGLSVNGNYERAYLKGVNLSNADLSDTEFKLEGTNLEGANLERADLQGVQFDHQTDLRNANLKGAIVSGTGPNSNALRTARVVGLSDTQWNQLKYSR